MSGKSQEFVTFETSGKCPKCGVNIKDTRKYFKDDGTEITSPDWHFFWFGNGNVLIGCPHCNNKWAKWDNKEVIILKDTAPISNKNNDKAPFSIIELTQSQEVLGTEFRLIDNSQSAIDITREITVSREWSKSYTMEYEKAISAGAAINFGIIPFFNLRPQIEKLVKSTYSISQESKNNHTEKIICNVPAHKKLRLFLHWKNVYQQGVVRVIETYGDIIDIPFKVVIGITFDQTQVNE